MPSRYTVTSWEDIDRALARYEVHLDRELERTVAMLVKLRVPSANLILRNLISLRADAVLF